MSFLSRQLAAAGVVAALALGVGAGSALAATGTSPSSAAKTKTPLVAAMANETRLIEIGYPGDGLFYRSEMGTAAAVRVIDGEHADSAQLPAKLEWILGADVLIRAEAGLGYGEQKLAYHHTSVGTSAIKAAFTQCHLANYYIADADSQLGVAHRALVAEPNRLLGHDLTSAETRSNIADVSTTSLAAAIHSAPAVIDQSIPSGLGNLVQNGPNQITTEIVSNYLPLNEAAGDYYGVIVGRLHVDAAQRPAQREWVEGMHALQQGDEQLLRAAEPANLGATTGSRDVMSALTTLRRANSQISHADALLHIHQAKPVRLPAKVDGLS